MKHQTHRQGKPDQTTGHHNRLLKLNSALWDHNTTLETIIPSQVEIRAGTSYCYTQRQGAALCSQPRLLAHSPGGQGRRRVRQSRLKPTLAAAQRVVAALGGRSLYAKHTLSKAREKRLPTPVPHDGRDESRQVGTPIGWMLSRRYSSTR